MVGLNNVNVSNESETGLINRNNYGPYLQLVDTGFIEVRTSEINKSNWMYHLNSLDNIFKDGIETDQVHNMMIHIIFDQQTPVADCHLSIFDYFINLIMNNLILATGNPMTQNELFFSIAITRKTIKEYIDRTFIDRFRSVIPNITMNNIIDDTLYEFTRIDHYSLYLCNTINLEDDIMMMNKYPEYYELYHADLSQYSLEDVKSEGMIRTNKVIEYIKNSDHCLADAFAAREGVNEKQFKEQNINIGSKPDGKGGVYPFIINKSFINGGVSDLQSFFVESAGGRLAQIISKMNVGSSGYFARLLGLNNRDTRLHNNPHYVCNTRNFQELVIRDDRMLSLFNDRYYRMNPNGMETKLVYKRDKHLIGQKIYMRSPMTCASNSHGNGICYRCYGDLAYTNRDINIGQLAAELLSSDLTQRLLSAKHLLESRVQSLNWTDSFLDYFEFNFNIINTIPDFDYKGYKLLIDPESFKYDSEEDGYEFNESVPIFEVMNPDGTIVSVHTEDMDNIYISNELSALIRDKGEPVNGKVELDMTAMTDINIFLVNLTNDELSKTLEMTKSIINKDAMTSTYDRNSFLQAFVETTLDGGLDIHGIHSEIILSNQIRNESDILLKPDWSFPNETYQILTMNKALSDNPSVTISLQYNKVARQFFSPLTYRKNKPSIMDLLFMERPQDFMVNRALVVENNLKSDIDEARPLIRFAD